MNSYDIDLVRFIKDYPGRYFAISGQADKLCRLGYRELKETDIWNLSPGGKYYVARNDSSLIAFRIPKCKPCRFRIMASHSDSPSFKIKENPETDAQSVYIKLNVELYGGAILSTWFDRPLSVAGRVFTNINGVIRRTFVNIDRDFVMIPSLSIHMNREINKGYCFNVSKDIPPMFSGVSDGKSFMSVVAECAGTDPECIVGYDLFLYNRQAPSFWGCNDEFMSSPRLDDMLCAYASLMGFFEADESDSIPVHAVFDSEEVGSSTFQGAASTFLNDTLLNICDGLGLTSADYRRMTASSFMLSADNAHACHPNYMEMSDTANRPVLGNGVVLKLAGNQKYTTDGMSAAIVRSLAQEAGINLQVFTNRSDIPGGSTLGNISVSQVAVPTADIGIAQLAMHSSYETCGCGDTEQLVKLAKIHYSK